MGEDAEKYRFVVEWFDSMMQTARTFLLTFYQQDKSVEMYDIKYKRIFLRKTKCENVKLDDLYVGSTVSILTRQLNIVDYGDKMTKEKLGIKTESTLCVIKASGLPHLGKILDILQKNDLHICKARMIKLSDEGESPEKAEDKNSYSSLVLALMPGPVVALELRGPNGFAVYQSLLKNTDQVGDRKNEVIKVELGQFQSMCFGPQNEGTMKNELEFFFPSSGFAHCNTAVFTNTTCCIIKPHAVQEGQVGNIIQAIIDAGFQICALEMFCLDYGTAEEFCEVYKGVIAEYLDMVSHMSSGPCIAMEIVSVHDENTSEKFRQFVGPLDPEVARHLRPHTLRARFGSDKVKNAVHCTDLPEDAQLEVEYFFRILTLQ